MRKNVIVAEIDRYEPIKNLPAQRDFKKSEGFEKTSCHEVEYKSAPDKSSNYPSPHMSNFLASSDERSSLLSNLNTTLFDTSLQADSEVDFPQQEGVNQELGVVKLDFRLFVSLLYDSVPGQFFF